MPGPQRTARSRARAVRAALALTLALASACLVASPAAAAAPRGGAPRAAAVPGPVVLVGTGGLRWSDVSPGSTPALHGLAERGAVGTVAVRSVRPTTCPLDGWLAVSAGRRAADDIAPQPRCRSVEAANLSRGGAATVTGWERLTGAAADEDFDATPGLLGDTLAAAHVPAAAVGPGAVLALAGSRGTAARAWPGLGSGDATLATGAAAGPIRALVEDVRDAVASGPRLLVVDVGGVGALPGGPSPAQQAAEVDVRIGAVLQALPPSATVHVVSLYDRSTRTPSLQLAAARGPAPDGHEYDRRLLGSRSTRQDGMVQATDVMPTLLAALGVPAPGAAVGSPVLPVGGARGLDARLRRVLDLAEAADAVHPITPWFFNSFVLGQIVLYGAATIALRRRSRSGASDAETARARRRILRRVRAAAVLFASVPAATFLANLLPWWRASVPGLAVAALAVGFALPIALLALRGPWREQFLGPFAVVGGITAAVLAGDVLTGSHLVLSSLMGVQPVVAGRFYGFSNPGFALFATGCLLLATALADRLVRAGRGGRAALAVAAVGIVATVVDGTPGLGSDFGGPPAIVPAFAVLAILVAGARITWQRVVLIVVGTLAVLTALSVADWLRPDADRTHLGRFVQTLLDGDAWPVVRRKASQNLEILLKPISIPLPFAIAFVALVLAKPVAWGARPLQLAYDRSPVLRPGLVAFAVMVAAGFALNDSGTVIPAVAATVAIPLLIAVSVRALELDSAPPPVPGRGGGAPTPRRRPGRRVPASTRRTGGTPA